MLKTKSKIVLAVSIVSAFLLLFCVALVITFFVLKNRLGYEEYDNQPIIGVYKTQNHTLLVTEDGGYIWGGYHNTHSKSYSRVERYTHNDNLGTPAPVKVINEPIKDVFIYGDYTYGELLYRNYNNELYKLSFSYMEPSKIRDNADGTNYISHGGDLYYIDSENNFCVEENYSETPTELATGISKAVMFFDGDSYDFYMLTTAGQLSRLEYQNGEYLVTNTEFSGVKDFTVETNCRCYNGKNFYNDYSNPLINVLFYDGRLLAKGTYGTLDIVDRSSKNPPNFVLNDWTEIGQNVVEFAAKEMGTVMLLADGSAAYYGIDPDVLDPSAQCKYITLDVENATQVFASELFIGVLDSDGNFYTWGEGNYNNFIGRLDELNAFADEPHVVKLNVIDN